MDFVVAVAAHDDTLRDLLLQLFETPCVPDNRADLQQLVFPLKMVKLEAHDLPLGAAEATSFEFDRLHMSS